MSIENGSKVSALDVYKLGPLIEKAVEEDAIKWQEARKQRKTSTEITLKTVWGVDLTANINISPSIASNCLRWVGYENLDSEYTPAPRSFKSEMELMMGSAAHFSLLRKLSGLGSFEQDVKSKEGISGRTDFIFQNPKTQEWQVLDIKFLSNFGFRNIKREGISKELKNTKNVYVPTPEHRLQLLLYMRALRGEGKNVTCGNVFYINRDTAETKEALVLWDSKAEYEVKEFLAKIKEAVKKIQNKELPEPTVQSDYICGKFCPFRIYCDYGQKFAAGQIRKESKKKPLWVYKRAKEQASLRQEKLEKAGISQPGLFPQNQ